MFFNSCQTIRSTSTVPPEQLLTKDCKMPNTTMRMHYCTTCESQTMHLQQRPNHILHLLLTLVTGGLWLLVWIFMSSSKSQCSECAHNRTKFDALVGVAETHKPGSTEPNDEPNFMYNLGRSLRGKKSKRR